MAFRFKGMGYKMTRPSMSPIKSVLGAHSATNENQDDKISKRMTTTDAMTMNRVKKSPLKQGYSNPNVLGNKDATNTTDTTGTTDFADSSEINSKTTDKDTDPKTGYYNPFETLAKATLQPSTERAQQRVTNRQTKRNESLVTKNASPEKIARVKARQTTENNRRFPVKDAGK